MIQIVSNEQLEQIISEALILFPRNIEYESEANEDGSYPVVDMNQEKRDEWIDEKVEELENVVNIDRFIKNS